MRKGGCCVLLAALLVGVTLGPSSVAAETRVLVRTGQVVQQSFGLDSVSEPSAPVAGRALFRGTSSALVAVGGGEVLVRTGDALPPPLSGTFNQIGSAAIGNAGVAVFGATLNSTAGEQGVFFFQDGAIVPLRVEAEAFSFGDPYVNGRARVVYRAGSGSITLLSAPTGETTEVVHARDPAPGGGSFRRVGPPVVNDGEMVAFVALTTTRTRGDGGVFVWNQFSGVSQIARSGGASPIAGTSYGAFDARQAVAISEQGDVAFVARLGDAADAAVFLFERATGTTSVVARVGELAGGEGIIGFYNRFVGVDSRQTVAFVAEEAGGRKLVLDGIGSSRRVIDDDVSDGSDFAPRLTDDGSIAWMKNGEVRRYSPAAPKGVLTPDATLAGGGFTAFGPSLGSDGATIFGISRQALYALDGDGVRLVATAGSAGPGLGPIGFIQSFTLLGKSPVLIVGDGTIPDSSAIVVARDGASGKSLQKIIATGDPVRGGGALGYPGDYPVAVGRSILSIGTVTTPDAPGGRDVLLHVTRSGKASALVRDGDRFARGRFLHGLWSLAVDGPLIAFFSAVDDAMAQAGIFARRHRRITPVAVVGDATADGQVFTDLGSAVVAKGRVLFKAETTGDADRSSVFAWRRGRPKRIVTDGDTAAGGIVDETQPLGVLGRRPVLRGRLTVGETVRNGVFLVRDRDLEPLVLDGDTTSDGNTINAPDGFVAGDSAILFTARLTGPSPSEGALIAVDARR